MPPPTDKRWVIISRMGETPPPPTAMTTTPLRRRNLRRRQATPIRIEHILGFVPALIWTGHLIQIHHLLAPACSPITFAECREGR
jgi:hypothetical protein